MKRPEWKPHDCYSGTDIHDDYEELWAYVEHLEESLGSILEFKLSTTLDILNKVDSQTSGELHRMAKDAVMRRFDGPPSQEDLHHVARVIVNSKMGDE